MLRFCPLLICCWLTGIVFSQQTDSFSGDWKCAEIRCDKMCEECCIYDYYDLQIGDSIRMFRYPYQYIGAFELDPSHWQFSNDTLISGNDDVQFCYLPAKEPFNPEIIKVLLRDSINPNGLINKKWLLQTWQEDTIGEEGFDHSVRYPVKLPKSIYFTSETINHQLKGNHLTLKINGKNRLFTIMELTNSRLTLRSENWLNPPFECTYLRSE